MILTIPDEVIQSTGISETELLREIAIILFKDNQLSIGRASRLASMNLLEFRRLLASRKISVGYGISEFQEDLKTIEKMQSS